MGASDLVLHSQVVLSMGRRDPSYHRAIEVVIYDMLNEKYKCSALKCRVCVSPAGMSPDIFTLLISLN